MENTLENRVSEIFKKQKEFQKLMGLPVDSIVESERNEMGEKFLFKTIEEIIELRREFPSMMNPWSKHQKSADISRIHEELSDVILFLINFINVWKIEGETLIETLEQVQKNNYLKVKEKMMEFLNQEILGVPGYTSCIGSGSLMPKYVFIGQNPGHKIPHGYKAFSGEEVEGAGLRSAGTVLSANLMKAQISKDDCYFTNLVKSTTENNQQPDIDSTIFWTPFLLKELDILLAGNSNCKIIAMGNWVDENLKIKHRKIPHPSAVLYGFNEGDFRRELDHATSSNN